MCGLRDISQRTVRLALTQTPTLAQTPSPALTPTLTLTPTPTLTLTRYHALLAHANACREFQPSGVVAFAWLSRASLLALDFHRAPACLAWHAASGTAVFGPSRSGSVSVAQALRRLPGWIVAQTNDPRWLHGLETVAQTQAGFVYAQRIVVLVRNAEERARSLAALLLSWTARPEMATVLEQFLGPVEPLRLDGLLSQEGVLQKLIDRCDALQQQAATAPLLRAKSAYVKAARDHQSARGYNAVTVAYVCCSDDFGASLGATLGIAGLAVGRLHSSGSEVRPPRSMGGGSGAHATRILHPIPHPYTLQFTSPPASVEVVDDFIDAFGW